MWFSPVCDTLYLKLTQWRDMYEKGKVFKIHKELGPRGDFVDVPTQYLHSISFSKNEIDNLVRITAQYNPGPLAKEIESIATMVWPHGKMTINGERIIKVALYKEHLLQLIEGMGHAKKGNKERIISSKPVIFDRTTGFNTGN